MRKILFTAVLIQFFAICAFTQTTEFTFQGNLKDGTNPANANYDFEFALYDSLSTGTQLGSTLTRNAVAVSSGTFAVKLDFGAQFTGANRFLEIRVRPTGVGAFQLLSPRQQLSSAPYSINAAQLGGLNAGGFIQNTTNQQPANFNISGNGAVGGRFGIGTPSPVGNLHINVPGSGNPISALTLDVGTFGTPGNAVNSYYFRARDIGSGGAPAFLIRGDGNVGIGTASPAEKLTVSGTIQSSSGGFRFPDDTMQTTSAAYAGYTNTPANAVPLPNYPGSGPVTLAHLNLPAGTYLLEATIQIDNNANFFGQNNQRTIVCDLSFPSVDIRAYRTIMAGLTQQTMNIHTISNVSSTVDARCETEFAPNNPTTGVSVTFRRLSAVRIPGGLIVQ